MSKINTLFRKASALFQSAMGVYKMQDWWDDEALRGVWSFCKARFDEVHAEYAQLSESEIDKSHRDACSIQDILERAWDHGLLSSNPYLDDGPEGNDRSRPSPYSASQG